VEEEEEEEEEEERKKERKKKKKKNIGLNTENKKLSVHSEGIESETLHNFLLAKLV
jgi:hypothetical protein